MKRILAIVAVAAGLAVVGRAEESTSAESVVKFATAKLAEYKAWSADYLQSMSAMGGTMTITGEMITKQPKRMRMDVNMPMMGKNITMTMIMGADGIMWQDMNMGGQRQVMKMDMNKVGAAMSSKMGLNGDPTQQMDPAKQWAALQQMFAFKLLPAAEIEGQKMHVLEGTMLPGALTNQQMAAAAQFIGKMRVYVGQQDGFTHKTEMVGKDGTNVVMTQEFKNLKFNPDIPDDTFVFTPPADVRIVDMTDMVNKMNSGAAPSPHSAPPPAK